MRTHYLSFFTITFLLLLDISFGIHDFSTEFHFSAALAGEDYLLHWNVDVQNSEITFGVNVSTTGWVGFGLSPNGQIPGSDVIIAWVDNTGQAFLQDRHALGRFLPQVDDSQDWVLISGEEEDGRTILEFSRTLLSCDGENDFDITADTARVVWSLHSRDPSSEEELASLQHERMGSASLNLLGGLNEDKVEDSSNSFQILNDNVLIPDNDTTYWCTVHALPNETVHQEWFIYKFSPVIPEPSAPYVHHIVAYLCTNLDNSHVGASETCDGSHIDIGMCRSTGILFAVWAVGGTNFVFPKGVGYPIGGKGQQYVVLELHYDNPRMISGVVDNSGFEFLYVTEEPSQRAGLLTFGHRVAKIMVIPPQADNFIINALTPSNCTQQFFPSEGIHVFGNLLHTHLAGHGLVVRHLRETSQCGGLEELQPIDENRRYDFNYQQVTILPRVVDVLPGDILHLQCFYRTTDPSYKKVTLGGESTRQEMCLTFLYYYPETDLTYSLGAQLFGEDFNSQYLSPEDQSSFIAGVTVNDRQSVSNILNQIEWNQESIASFQNSIQSSPVTTSCISTADDVSSITSTDALPQVKCPYQPPPKECPEVDSSGAELSCHNVYLLLMFLSVHFALYNIAN